MMMNYPMLTWKITLKLEMKSWMQQITSAAAAAAVVVAVAVAVAVVVGGSE